MANYTINKIELPNGDICNIKDTTYTGGTGISINNNEINHSNLINPQTTQAIYPIKIDAQGHISEYGNAVGIDITISDDSTSVNLPTTSAVVNFISTKTAGLTGAMHFKGVVNSLPDATDATTYSNYEAGDVVLIDNKEYVYNKGLSASNSSWVLLGDESSYALKNETIEKTIFNSAGQLIYSSAANTPEVLSIPNILANKTYVLKINNNNVPNWEEEYSYTLPMATDTILGGIKITNPSQNELSNRNYNISLNNLQYAYVNVPWTDTLYGVAANSSLSVTNNVDLQSNKYLFSHNVVYNASDNITENINTENTINLQFSDTFNIPKISYDSNGHITKVDLATFSLPSTSDEKVKQTPTSSEAQTQWRRLLLGYLNVPNLEVPANEVTDQAYFYQSLAADAKTGTLRANRYRVLDNVDIEWNDSDASLDFIFI